MIEVDAMQIGGHDAPFLVHVVGLARHVAVEADQADLGTITDIPDTSGTPGRASWAKGFTLVNMVPIPAGGIPPFGQDMNGALNPISAWIYWVQAGGAPVALDRFFCHTRP